jgi:ankyrin repeat protein
MGDLNYDLIKATEKGDLNKVELLLQKGADVNYIFKYGQKSSLMIASEGGYLDTVKLLLENGADVNLINNYGQTALYLHQKKIVWIYYKNYY